MRFCLEGWGGECNIIINAINNFYGGLESNGRERVTSGGNFISLTSQRIKLKNVFVTFSWRVGGGEGNSRGLTLLKSTAGLYWTHLAHRLAQKTSFLFCFLYFCNFYFEKLLLTPCPFNITCSSETSTVILCLSKM